MSPGSTSRPLRPSSIRSGIPPTREPTHRTRAAERLDHDPAETFGARRAAPASSPRPAPPPRPASTARGPTTPGSGSSATRRSTTSVRVPLPTIRSRASGQVASDAPPGVSQAVDVLVAPRARRRRARPAARAASSADARGRDRDPCRRGRRRPARRRRRGRARSCSRRSSGPRRRAGARTRTMRSPSGPSSLRCGEPYSRVDVRQSACTSTITLRRDRARPCAPGAPRDRLVRALGDHRVRAGTLAQLARDAVRQRQVEEQAVEPARPERRHEPERRVAGRSPAGALPSTCTSDRLARARPTCARGSSRAAAGSASGRRRARAASPGRRPAGRARARRRRGRARGAPPTEPRRPQAAAAARRRAKNSSIARRERRRVARLDEQAVRAVARRSRRHRRPRRDHRRADRERLDDRVREVLPGRGEQRRVARRGRGRAPAARGCGPRKRARTRGSSSAARRSSAGRSGPSPTTTSDTSSVTRERLECDVRAPSAPSAVPRRRATAPVHAELRAARSRGLGERRQRTASGSAARSRASAGTPQPNRELAEVVARAEDVRGAANLTIPRGAERPSPKAAMRCLELFEARRRSARRARRARRPGRRSASRRTGAAPGSAPSALRPNMPVV